jgi:hypothetical protein
MSPNKILQFSAAGLLALCGLAQAQTPAAGPTPARAQASARPGDAPVVSPAAWFAAMDSDHSGQLSLAEFLAGLEARNEEIFKQRLQAQFRTVDKDKSGFLEAGEFAALPILKAAKGAPPSLAQVDTNGDGKLNFDEYVGLLDRLMKSRR